ncbi:hypothetical protein TCAL_11012 [Tigriopus californicus]|uniref:Protein zwilch n=1 Tax=Tigriopus californicus TaxID=6832 RepID=A0A553NT01_TIGCA|nr:hypothetical protein TCAL_11012 [Tigriopus californicus]|eukprot:TCALIF_11012-PA protein Name:"Similar to ZWILCH Protein zwilch homolog (Pongo abelii)" AED:0.00 eAED:0.00 QI:17/1/1/1/1/1/9/221/622
MIYCSILGGRANFEVTDVPELIETFQWESHLDELQIDYDDASQNCVALVFKSKLVTNAKGGGVTMTKPCTPARSKSTRGPNPDLDLTGSPLKCSFTLDEDFDDSYEMSGLRGSSQATPIYVPLSTQVARSILSRVTIKTENDGVMKFPCWVFCDGQDDILYLGSQRHRNHVTVHSIRALEQFSSKESGTSKMSQILNQHHMLAPPSLKTPIKSKARAVFKLSEDFPVDAALTGHEASVCAPSSLAIEATWSKPKAILEKPSPDAMVSLRMNLSPGDERMASFGLWNELSALMGFMTGLNNEGITWMARDESVDLEKQIHDLIESVRNSGPGGQQRGKVSAKLESQDQGDDGDPQLDDVLSTVRSDLDFTDQLWMVLMQVQSLAELSAAFTYIFKTIQQEDLRPFMFSNSKSKTSKLICDLSRDAVQVPDMSGRFPLELLVEMGLEKLQRDYLHTLMSGYLATREDLEPFIAIDANVNGEEKLRNLFALHLALELVVLLQTYLSSSHDCLRVLVQKCLHDLKMRPITSVGEEMRYAMNFQLPSHLVKDQLSKLSPNIWHSYFWSEGDILSARSDALLTIDPPQEWMAIKQTKDLNSESREKEDLTYYFTLNTSITRFLETKHH